MADFKVYLLRQYAYNQKTLVNCRDRFQREHLGTAFPKLFWQWERRSH